MKNQFKILTVLGSPNDSLSNTRAFVEDFVDEVIAAGLPATHKVIPLGRKKVSPCKGCWNCTKGKICPLHKDDLEEIKREMIACDMLILATPVYTNQVSAQMKALFDRLFTWCHIFPLLGKYSLSVCTTGNDGFRETGDFLEKMLGTYGTSSFGTIYSAGAFTPGFFPRRETARNRYKKLAKRVAETLFSGRKPHITNWQRRMFKVMKKKMSGVHAINYLRYGPVEGQPNPPGFLLWMLKKIMKKRNVTDEQIAKLAGVMTFELSWWRHRNWLSSRSLKQLMKTPVPDGFDIKQHLLQPSPVQQEALV